MSDFTDGAPRLAAWDDPEYADSLLAFNKWVADNANSMPDAADFDPLAGVPHFQRDYSRFFSLLAVKLFKYYMAHKDSIDTFLTVGFIAAMNDAVSFVGEALQIDQIGPN